MADDLDDVPSGGSMALVPYQRMDMWELLLQHHGERRESALQSSVVACRKQPKWAFTVRLVSEDERLWPDEKFSFGVDLDNGMGAIHVVDRHVEGRDWELVVEGEGEDRGRTCCDVRSWDVTAQPEVSLPGDDGRTFEVKIRARWIALRIRRHDRDEVVPGVKLELTLPDAVGVETTTNRDTLHVQREFTKLGTVAVEQMTVAEGVWEYVP